MSFPFFGEEFTFAQPDGTRLPVRGWGDQRRAVFETLDGYTVTRDPVPGFYRYALVTPDGMELRPTGVQPGAAAPRNLGLRAGVRVSRAAARAQAEGGPGLPQPRWEIRREHTKAMKRAARAANILPAPPSRQTVGGYVGLCLLVQFPEVPGVITREEVEACCNQQGYTGLGHRGSGYDYFRDTASGTLRHTTVVAPDSTAQPPRESYTNPAVAYGRRARELIREALADHLAHGFDFSGLTVDDEGDVYATSVFSAGNRVNNWSQGLWPHASRLVTPYPLAAGVRAYDYQLTDRGDALTLGTYCHETGHRLCDFPDLYDYGAPGIRSAGSGAYCLMCAGGNANRRNPTQVGAYLKYQAGRANSRPEITRGLAASAPAGTNDFFIHARSPGEYFILENRHKAGRDEALPDSGWAIWHADALGDNSHEQMTPASPYECSLEQADGRFDLERGEPGGGDQDLFHAGWKDRFDDATRPNGQWWDGTSSGLKVYNISPAAAHMPCAADICASPGGPEGPPMRPCRTDAERGGQGTFATPNKVNADASASH